MRDLLDADVLLALSAPGHIHHARALRYWRTEAAAEQALCRITALALLRLLTNPMVVGSGAVDGHAAWTALERWLAVPQVALAAEPHGLDDWLAHWSRECDLRGGAWTDAYLAAFALAGDCRLVTFDRGFARFRGLDWLFLRPDAPA